MTNPLAKFWTPSRPESPVRLHVLIVGAGIGGLSLAILLAQAGHRVSAVERKPSFDSLSTGGGLNVTANAVHALQLMGIGKNCNRSAIQYLGY
jgi:salicylate hydroxylase